MGASTQGFDTYTIQIDKADLDNLLAHRLIIPVDSTSTGFQLTAKGFISTGR